MSNPFPMAPVDPCAGRPDGATCIGGVTVAPPNPPGTPTSGQWIVVIDFSTTPPSAFWQNAAGEFLLSRAARWLGRRLGF